MATQRARRHHASLQLEVDTLSALVMAGAVTAAADGELHPDELTVLSDVIEGFFHGDVSGITIRALIDRALDVLVTEGYEASLDSLCDALPSGELRELALMVSATVLLADGVHRDGDDEDNTYGDVATWLEISAERAREILEEMTAEAR